METIIITILILSYLMYKDYSYQKEMRLLFSLAISGEKNIDQSKKTSLLNKVFNKKEKNKFKELDDPYIPLEEVPEETIRHSLEGNMKQ